MTKFLIILFAVFLCLISSSYSINVYWDNSSGGNIFSDANNWGGASLPGVVDAGIILDNHYVEISTNQTIGRLQLGSSDGSTRGSLYVLPGANLISQGNLGGTPTDSYRDSSGNVIIAGGNLMFGTPSNDTQYCRFAQRSGSASNIFLSSGYFVSYSRFSSDRGSFYLNISGDSSFTAKGSHFGLDVTSEVESPDSDPDEVVVNIQDQAIVSIFPTSGWQLGTNGSKTGYITVNISGGHTESNKLNLGTVSSGNTRMYISGGNVVLTDYLYMGNSADDGLSLLEVSGTGNFHSNSSIKLYSNSSHIKMVGHNAALECSSVMDIQGNGNLHFVSSYQGVSPIVTNDLNINNKGQVNVDVSQLQGHGDIQLFNYSGNLTGSPFASSNVVGLTLGSDPLGDSSNLDNGQYFINYGSGSSDNVTLYYKKARSSIFFID